MLSAYLHGSNLCFIDSARRFMYKSEVIFASRVKFTTHC